MVLPRVNIMPLVFASLVVDRGKIQPQSPLKELSVSGLNTPMLKDNKPI